jgi:uncharacterized protein (TIGR03437 family)
MKIAIILSLVCLAAMGQVQVTVPANVVIHLAGQPSGTRSINNSRSAPADSPVLVNIALVAGQTLQFEATGAVDGSGPDGRAGCNDSFSAEHGVARVDAPCRSLVGVFLSDTSRAQPLNLDFRGDAKNLPVLRPLLQQPFFVGSGVTDQGDRRGVVVPTGATRLYLGPIAFGTSTGSFVVRVSVRPAVEIPGNPVRVSGMSMIHLAQQGPGVASRNGGSSPMSSPSVANLPLVAGQVLRIVASGSVDGTGPDGRPGCNTNQSAEFSIARIDTRCRALLGVFVSETTRTQPPALNFTGATRDAVRVEPLLQQPFLIGSGFTDAGELKQFVVPQGATQLVFGVNGNSSSPGSFIATVSPEAPATPTLQRSGITRAAGFGGGALAAGSIASLFGTNFAPSTASATAVPLPSQIGQTRVYFNLRPAPLYFTSAGQVNAQIPWELSNETGVQVVVVRNGAASLPVSLPLGPASPGIFLVKENAGVVVNANTGQLVDAQSGVDRGQALVIYASGLGAVNGSVASGVPSSSTELEPTRQPVEAIVSVGGQSVALPVLFAGSAPGFIGVNQVNLLVPSNAPTGVGTLILRTAGTESNSVLIAIQ